MGQAREEFELKLIEAREKYANYKQFQNVLDRFNKNYDAIGCKYIFPSKPDGKYVIIYHDLPDIRHKKGLDSDPVTVDEEYFFAGLSRELDSMLKHFDSLLEHETHPEIKPERLRKEAGETVKKNVKNRSNETLWNNPLYIAIVFILFILYIIALVCCTGMV